MNNFQKKILQDAYHSLKSFTPWEQGFIKNTRNKYWDKKLSPEQNKIINQLGTKMARSQHNGALKNKRPLHDGHQDAKQRLFDEYPEAQDEDGGF